MNERTIAREFYGELSYPDNRKIPVFVKYEYDELDITSIYGEIILLSPKEKHKDEYKIILGEENITLPLKINETYIIEKGNLKREISGKLTFSIRSISCGINNFHMSNPRIASACIMISPGELGINSIIKTSSPRGTIEYHHKKEKEIAWKTDIGTFSLHQTYNRFDNIENKRRIDQLAEQTQIAIDLKRLQNIDLQQIHKRILSACDDICCILGFCYRQSMTCYEIKYCFQEKEKSQIYVPFYKKVLSKNKSLTSSEPLVDVEKLYNGGFQILINALCRSSVKKSIKNSIQSLLASYENDRTVENSYFLAYSSLDSIVESLSSEYIKDSLIPAGKWKKIESCIRKSLNTISDNESDVYIHRIKRKLPELRRMSFFDKFLAVTKDRNICIDDILLEEEDIANASSIRNRLFHMANVISYTDMLKYLTIIQSIVERIILNLLDWPLDKLWLLHDVKLKGVISDDYSKLNQDVRII